MTFEKNIPIPIKGKKGSTSKYLWDGMEVGDSIFIDSPKEAMSAYQSVRKYCKKNNLEWDFTTRKEGAGKRLWRIK